jgi:TPR repeat protein
MRGSWFTALPILAWLVCPLSASALEPEAQAAKEEGMRLWGQHEWIEMQPYLEKAAEAGDVEAMYYLGEATRLLGRGLTEEAMDWYLQAAEQGDPYAMLRLFQGGACVAGDECPEDADGWREKALAETLPRAEAGDTDAMLALNYVYRALDEGGEAQDWLEQAAEQGNPAAQTRLGKYILDGQGWYFLESRRLEAAEEWFRKASEHGDVGERFGIGWCYLNPEELNSEAGIDMCQNKQDVVLGWAILLAMVEETSNYSAQSAMRRNKDEITSEEIEQAKVLAREWADKEPPLSNFPSRFGY